MIQTIKGNVVDPKLVNDRHMYVRLLADPSFGRSWDGVQAQVVGDGVVLHGTICRSGDPSDEHDRTYRFSLPEGARIPEFFESGDVVKVVVDDSVPKPSIGEERLVKKIMDDLDALQAVLYEQEDGFVGGPLHEVVSDGLLDDVWAVRCARATETGSWGVVTRVVCREMVHLLLLLTYPQRLVWYLRKRVQELEIDDVALAVRVKEGQVVPGPGVCGSRVVLDRVVLWEGLDEATRRRRRKVEGD